MRKKKQGKDGQHILRRITENYKILLGTYLMMLIVPLTIFTASVVYTGNEMKKESLEYQKAILAQAVSVGENILSQTQKAVYTATVDGNANRLLKGQDWKGKPMFDVADLVDKLLNLKSANDCIQSFGIYFYGSNSFVTDETRYPVERQEAYLERYDLSMERFEEETTQYRGYFLINGTKDRWLIFYQNMYDYSNKERLATAYAVLSVAGIEQELQYLNTLDGSSLFLIEENGEKIGSTGQAVDWEKIKEFLEKKEEAQQISFSDQETQIFCEKSEEFQLYYGMCLERNSVYHKVNVFLACCAGAWLFCMLAGIFLAIYFTWKTSAPVDHLLDMIQTNKQKYEGKFVTKSFKLLEDELLVLKKNNHMLTQQANSYGTRQMENALQGFMEGVYPDREWILEFREKEPRLQKIEKYQIVLFGFQNLEESRFIQDQKSSRESYSILFFSLKNIIDEAFLQMQKTDTPGISMTWDNMVVCIVPYTESSTEENEKKLSREAKTCIDFFREILELKSYAAVSNPHEDWTELSAAYKEASMTAAQVLFWEKEEEVAFYAKEKEEEKNSNGKELLELKKQLSASLLVNDYENARKTMNEMIDRYFSKDIHHLEYNQYQAYALVGMILDKLDNIEIQNQMKPEYASRLMKTCSIRELREEMNAVFDDIMEYRTQSEKESAWAEVIMEYVKENYRDPNLNISYIAEHFGVSSSHIGNCFRKQMGYGILDYIHMIRLEECKKMLREGRTIKYCAETVGYADIKTMQRAFKKYEGIGPGQYKEEMENQNNENKMKN